MLSQLVASKCTKIRYEAIILERRRELMAARSQYIEPLELTMIDAMSVREGQKRRRKTTKISPDSDKLSDLENQFFINALKNISYVHYAGVELGVKE